MKLFTAIAQTLLALQNNEFNADKGWTSQVMYDFVKSSQEERLERLVSNLPSGSGFDSGCKLDDSSRPDRLVINANFHHMSDEGFYDGWSDHQVIVTPCLAYDFNLRITGRNRNDIKAYIADVFHNLQEVD